MKKMILPLAAGMVLLSCVTSKQKKNSGNPQSAVKVQSDTLKKDTAKKASQIKPYKEVITTNAVTDEGLFKVHRIDQKFYFEIPDSLLNKDLLVVNRISRAAADVRGLLGMLGNPGDWISENVVQFTRAANNKLFLRRMSFTNISKDSSEKDFTRLVQTSDLQPIVAAFDIKAIAPDSVGTVIDVTDYLNTDNDVFFFHPQVKTFLTLGAIQPDKSYIQNITSFPSNIEIRTYKTYLRDQQKGFATYELNSSMVLLPQRMMQARLADDRVGYFTKGYVEYDGGQKVKGTSYITRWRLEPKEEDMDKYLHGQLVEPKKPIVFYIDPATPKKWVPYLIKGVNAWQKSFEQAGFKNAIYALEAPKDDSTFSLDDARHNAIIYKASPVKNASGPMVIDPRTGEILESHINWYHNVISLLHDWYMIQAGAIDSAARKMQFDDDLMGQLISFVCTHEVGHTLGLMHNFGASASIPVDSLRSSTYLAANGSTPSIMDYARFNYVAQPQDKIDRKAIIPRIGIYDSWAIEWGYKWLPQLKADEEEMAYMNKWIITTLSKDKRYAFGGENWGALNKAEDLGDDPVKAGEYGIANLKRELLHLKDWATTPNSNYKDLEALYGKFLDQYTNYLEHALVEVGGVQFTRKTIEQQGPVISFLSRERQRRAVLFLNKHLFEIPEWLFSKEIFSLIGGSGRTGFMRAQQTALNLLLFRIPWTGFIFSKAQNGEKLSYTFNDMLNDLEAGIFKQLNDHKPISEYQRVVQTLYIRELSQFVRTQKVGLFGAFDYCNQANDHIANLYKKITRALPAYTDKMTVLHLKEVQTRCKQLLDFQKKNFPEAEKIISGPANPNPSPAFHSLKIERNDSDINSWLRDYNEKGCWNFSNTLKMEDK